MCFNVDGPAFFVSLGHHRAVEVEADGDGSKISLSSFIVSFFYVLFICIRPLKPLMPNIVPHSSSTLH